MERGQEIERERQKGEANSNLAVLFSALHKDVVNVLDFMERLKNKDDQKAVDVGRVEKLKLELAFICTYIQLSYSGLEQFKDKMTVVGQKVKDLLRSILYDGDSNTMFESDMQHVLHCFMGNIDDCISSCHHSTSSATMTDEQLNFLFLNLHNISKYLAEQKFPLVTQYEILQNVCGSIRDFHGLIVNGCVEHEIVECVLPQFQVMAERVGLFIWDDQTDKGSQLSELDEDDQTDNDFQLSELDEDDQIDADSRLFKLAHLFLMIIPIELEVMNICFTNLETLTSAEVGPFIKKLLEISPDILGEYLIHLQEHMVNVITASTSGARNIHVMIEFLLIILTDVPKDFIHHDKLFDLLARVGALTREVSIVVHDLEEKSLNKESTDETNHATLHLLDNIKPLKEDLKHVYLKAPDASQCRFPMSDGPLFMHLLHRHLNDLLDSNAYSIALIKEEIGWVKEDLEFIRSFFVKVEQVLCKDLWARVLDVAYEAKDVIDSIIVRDNGLLHLIFSLPITINKIKLIKEDVSHLLEKIPKNRGLIVVNSPKKPVESKSLTAGKIIVGFEEETQWIIRKLTSGRDGLDVISITGMPGSGKTTLAYKVYNDKSVSSHFDIRAWCTVGQEYDEKKLLDKIFNQVIGSDSKLSENIDVADKLRKQLYGKRYLIVLDDLWDTATWDELTRPFPEVRNNLSSLIFNNEEEVMKVIEISYDHLPDHLKPCLLYFASFHEDREMEIDGLKVLWHAEGLVEQKEMLEVYLDNLISSSLVICLNEIGYEPTCQLHDLVHEFCLIKAREEKLFDLISSSAPSSSSDLMPRQMTIDYDMDHFGFNNLVLLDSKKKRHSGKHLYSLTITGDELDGRLSDICHLRHLRLLRVLNLDDSFITVKDSLLNEICMLNHLRFLHIGTEVKSLPSSFSNLLNLETLIVENEGPPLVLLPIIWNLVKLQVVVVDPSLFDLETYEPIRIAGDSKLENLRLLADLILSYSKDTEDIFKRFPNLQDLSFDLNESWDFSTERYWFPKLDFLNELESLDVTFSRSNSNDNEPSFGTNQLWDFCLPSSLKKLSLRQFPLTSDALSTIARLPKLEVLSLDYPVIQGEEWNLGEEDIFENLKCLKLHGVTLAKWEVGEESFTALEILQLQGCRKLEEIPPSFGDISSLKMIKLVQSPQLEDSAKNIKQYAEDIRGGDELQVLGWNDIPLFK